jgi:hypothetical protein
MYQRDIELSTVLHQNFMDTHSDIIKFHNITKISEEIERCGQLIRKIELEEELDHLLATLSAKVYVYDGVNEMPAYHTLYHEALLHGIEDLESVLKDFAVLGEHFHPSLQEKRDLCRVLLQGRKLLMLPEDSLRVLDSIAPALTQVGAAAAAAASSVGVDGNSSNEESKGSSSSSSSSAGNAISAAIAAESEPKNVDLSFAWIERMNEFEEGVTASLRGSKMLPEYIIPEYEIIVGELIRRSLLQGYMQILQCACITGEVDINVNVDVQKLADLFHQYNHLSQLMSDNYEEFPNNLKALTFYTSSVLKLRKHVVENDWGKGLTALLTQLEGMDHGGGSALPSVQAEIEIMKVELHCRRALATLKYALENIPVQIPDNPEDCSNVVDLRPLRAASSGIAGNNGAHSKQLKALADSVITILNALVTGTFAKIDQSAVDEAASLYISFQLNSTAIEKVFRYTRVHNFLKNLCDAMANSTSPEQLFTSINTVRNALLSVPQRFIPWLKAAYIYCEAVSANASEDWIKMVEATRKLEECIQLLTGVKIVAESEGLNENVFLELMHEKAATGYATALRIKACEQKQKVVEEIQGMSQEELNKLAIRQQDEDNPYGIAQLRQAGYDDASILNVKFPVKFLWALDFDPVLLRKKGFKAEKLLSAGYSISTLYQAGFK